MSDAIEGPSVRFFPNGQISEQRTFSGGKLDGRYIAFHETGKKAEQGEYKNGNKVGHWTTWNASGLVEEEKDYTPGQPAAATPVAGGTPSGPTPAATTTGPTAVAAVAGTEPPVAVAPTMPTTPTTPLPETAIREVTEHRFFAGRTQAWWEDRLTRIKQRVGAGELAAKMYELTKRRAQLNGLEVMDAQAEVKVRIAATPPGATQGGPP